MLWLDPTAAPVRSAVVSGGWGRAPHSDHAYPNPGPTGIDTIGTALAVACDVLDRFAGFAVHPAGVAVEDFIATPSARRLSPTFAPLRAVNSVEHQQLAFGSFCEQATASWTIVGNSIVFAQVGTHFASLEWWARTNLGYSSFDITGRPFWSQDRQLVFSVEYTFGSTITASARAAVVSLAHQLYLRDNPCSGCGECVLPSRTTQVTREGITMDMDVTSLDGLTGLPEVDLWLKTVNPKGALRKPGVWTPDSPPPVAKSVRVARPTWQGSELHSDAVIGVTAGVTT
jgi:hypothetical protein